MKTRTSPLGHAPYSGHNGHTTPFGYLTRRPAGGALSNAADPEPRGPRTAEPASEHPSRPRGRLHAARAGLRARRERIRRRPTLNATYRTVLGVFGTLVLLAGLVMIPYPGPGWLVVFAGLGILATEFQWAHRVNSFAKRHYGRWVRWLGRQHLATKLVVMGATGLVVVATLWVLGLFAAVGSWFDLRWKWLASPLFGP